MYADKVHWDGLPDTDILFPGCTYRSLPSKKRNKKYRLYLKQDKLAKLYKETRFSCAAGVYFDRFKKRLIRYSNNRKSFRKAVGRALRHRMNQDLGYEVADGSGYKRHKEYWWVIY